MYSTGSGNAATLPYAGAFPISTDLQYGFKVYRSAGSGIPNVYVSSGAQFVSTTGRSLLEAAGHVGSLAPKAPDYFPSAGVGMERI